MLRILAPRAPAATMLVRVLAGAVLLGEGIQKFLGVGRFEKIDIPAAHVTVPLDEALEIFCGALFLIGFLTRTTAIPMLVDIVVAIVSTNIPILSERGFWIFSLSKTSAYGFWSRLHEARVDWAMLCGPLFLPIVGAGPWSFDAKVSWRGSTAG